MQKGFSTLGVIFITLGVLLFIITIVVVVLVATNKYTPLKDHMKALLHKFKIL